MPSYSLDNRVRVYVCISPNGVLRIISIGLTIAFHSFLQILFVESLGLVAKLWVGYIL